MKNLTSEEFERQLGPNSVGSLDAHVVLKMVKGFIMTKQPKLEDVKPFFDKLNNADKLFVWAYAVRASVHDYDIARNVHHVFANAILKIFPQRDSAGNQIDEDETC
jgi:hypothetical protein